MVPLPASFCPLCPTLRPVHCMPSFVACPLTVIPHVLCSPLLARNLRESPVSGYCCPALLPQPLSLCLFCSAPSTTLTPSPYPVIHRVLLDLRHLTPPSPVLPCHN